MSIWLGLWSILLRLFEPFRHALELSQMAFDADPVLGRWSRSP